MSDVKIVVVGAGSQSFGPAMVRDILLSEPLAEVDVQLTLMDKSPDCLGPMEHYANHLKEQLGRKLTVCSTVGLDRSLDGADFVITAIEVKRYLYWSQDFHIPRRYGFHQIYGENGGIGGLFHALRNIPPMIEIARAMERLCPDAWLLNFTNPEHKICEALTRLSPVKSVGLCHGIFGAMRQLAMILDMAVEDLDTAACGINHFTWFQRIRDRRTGEDLYPRLREAEKEGDWMAHWDELAMSRILFRRYGLWPSPATNHFGEYIRWAQEFWPSEVEYFYDPADGEPWKTGVIPDFIYSLDGDFTPRPGAGPWRKAVPETKRIEDAPLKPSGEVAAPIIESLACGVAQSFDAVNIPNAGAIPNLPDSAVVEVPATADASGLKPCRMEALPEGIVTLLRVQTSIHQLLIEAYTEESKDKLLQAVLLEPTVDSYHRAVACVEEMLRLQGEILPPLK